MKIERITICGDFTRHADFELIKNLYMQNEHTHTPLVKHIGVNFCENSCRLSRYEVYFLPAYFI